MKGKQIKLNKSRTDLGVATYSNVAGEISRIFEVTCPPGVMFTLWDATVLMCKLYDTNPVEVEEGARIVLGVKKPGDVFPTVIAEVDYTDFKALTWKDQANQRYQERLQIPLIDENAKTIFEKEKFVVMLNSAKVVVWVGNSELQFRVEENSMRAI